MRKSITHAEAVAMPVTPAKPFGRQDKLGYMFGDLGNTLTFSTVTTFLMIFYTNALGVSAGIIGILFLVARIIDAFADLGVGRLVDNSSLHADGRFHPWIRRMKYPLFLFSILLFLPGVSGLPMGLKIGYISVTYIAWGILYSTVNIPYGSMASAISNDPADKTSLSTFRSIGAAVGTLLVSYFVPMFMYAKGSQQISSTRLFIIVMICAAAGVVAYTLLGRMTTERVRTEKSENIPLKVIGQKLLTDKALIVLVVIDVLVCVGLFSYSALVSYLFNDYFKDKGAMALAMVSMSMATFLLAPFANKLYRRFGRKEITESFLAFGALMFGVLLVVHTHSVTVYLVLAFFAALGMGMFNLMVWAFITDVIDNQQAQTGIREDGVVYGVNSFARKVAQALAGGVAGLLLSFIGYKTSTSGGVLQTEAVNNGIYQLSVGIPAVCLGLGAIIMFFWYPLNKQKVDENAKALKAMDQD
ncbi:MFS transporter [Levilactobacillus zymae]|uniref:MFS transporter n=1 Tax=Levilactobacillus zymae TaxID=267363 RepID=UPI0028B7D8EB|nr:MFS transporter [Levilactobacillus zymae]MDT6979562.1 MFS transporter [Levilactobacillus zymae]